MVPWPGAVIFDFDGVITHSEPLHFVALRDTLAAEGISLGEEEYYRETIGLDDRSTIRLLYRHRQIELDSATFGRVSTGKSGAFMDLIRQRRCHALPGVCEFVRRISRAVPLAICSASRREEIEAMLDVIALRECFSVLITNDDVTVPKPDPQGYLLAVRRLGEKVGLALAPGDCLVVEDAPKVVRAVKQVGFPTLGVATSYPIESLSDANWAVKSLRSAEVVEAIPQLRRILYDEPAEMKPVRK